MVSILLSSTLLLSVLLLQPLSNVHGAQLIQSFGNCPELNNYYRNRVINLIGPYGLNSQNAYTNTRYPDSLPDNPGTPGGPAGLRRKRPFHDPKRVHFSNITNGVIDDNSDDNGLNPGNDFSTTNVQVKGVDEPDIIKTDGRRVFTISGNIFSVVEVMKNGTTGRRVGKLTLPSYPEEMLIEGNYVVVIGYEYNYKRPVYRRYKKDPSYGESALVFYQINVNNNRKPRLVSKLYLEGNYVSSREVDGTIRVVMRFSPLSSIWLYYPYGKYTKAMTEKWNREIIQYSQPGNWLPTYILQVNKGRQYGAYVTCGEVYYSPDVFSGFDILTVVTIPLNKLMVPKTSAGVVSDADKVYATKTKMYVTTSEFHFDDVSDNSARWGANYKTSIHQFGLSNNGASYIASGRITGSVIDQFAMSEYNGNFFIATTDGAPWWGNRDLSASKVTSFKTIKETKTMMKLGEVGNLGLGERIYAVRFRGDVAYVVTFRETDPLYIIDISNPRKMRAVGELKIPGFSSYLHVVSPDRLLGVGQEATLTGRTTGTKVSLFDVSDVTKPKELSTWTLSGAYSNVEWDHRAFLYWRKLRLAVMPVDVYYYGKQFYGAVVLRVTDSKIVEVGRVTHRLSTSRYTPSIIRNAVIGDGNLWSMSYGLLQVNNLFNLTDVQAQIKID